MDITIYTSKLGGGQLLGFKHLYIELYYKAMPGKQGQAKIKKQKQPLNSQVSKLVCVSTLIFSQKKILLWIYSCFIHNSKMFGNVDFHIPEHIQRNKF